MFVNDTYTTASSSCCPSLSLTDALPCDRPCARMALGRVIKRRKDVRMSHEMSHDTTSPNRQRPILHLRQANGSTRAGPAERGSTQGTDQERRVAAPREPHAASSSECCAS